MQAKAEARYIRISAQKARLVVDLIRGKQAGAAINTLRAANKRIAPTVEKVLQSAIANAQNLNEDVDVDELVVSEAYVNEGPRMKPGADGPRLPVSAALGAHRRQSSGQRGIDGTKSSPIRIPAGLQ
jgi:large subunit ribosomal protein L22